MTAYFYAPRRDYRDSDGTIESREPLPLHDPEYWSAYTREGIYLMWVADFYEEEDANAFCDMKNKEQQP